MALSTIEAGYLARKFITETCYQGRGIAEKCRERSRILDEKVSRFSQHYPETQDQPMEHVKRLEEWYATQGLDCTFLVDKRCSIYADRPLVCRQWRVADSSNHCKATGASPRHQIPELVSLTDVLVETASHYQGGHELVLLPATIAWYHRHQKRLQQRHPAIEVVDTFLKCVHAHVAKQEKPTLTIRVERFHSVAGE